MPKKIILNLLIIVFTYFFPSYLLHNNQDISDLIQNYVLIVIFFGAVSLVYLNNNFRKQAVDKKWIWVIFEAVGVLGILYSGFILWLLFEFRHGIGF